MPQPIQGPTLAEVASNAARREKEIKRKERNEKNKSYFVNYINNFIENYE